MEMSLSIKKKEELRKKFLKICSSLSALRKEQATNTASSFLRKKLENLSCILSFASTQNEINLWPLNDFLLKDQRLVLPRVEENQLCIYKVDSKDTLILSKWNILEPNPKVHQREEMEKIDCVLVPAIAFDKLHHRIGYGKGLYDRFLAQLELLQLNPLIFGIGYKEQLSDEILPCEAHDKKTKELYLF